MNASQLKRRESNSSGASSEGVSCGHKIAGLLFDMGDVLYDATAWRRWLLHLLSRMGLHTQYGLFYRVWECEYLEDVCCGRREYWDALRDFLLTVGLSRGQLAELEAAGRSRREHLEENLRAFPSVAATLAHLVEDGYCLAAMANSPWSGDALRGRLERIGLGDFFTLVLSSRDLERVKPDRRCYTEAVAAMDLECSSVAFVGHDFRELAGARRAGLRTIAFNADAYAVADVYLNLFSDLRHSLQPQSAYRLAG